MTIVVIDPLPDGKVRLTPCPRPQDRWQEYLDACRAGGARMDSILRGMVAPMIRVADLVSSLDRAGFRSQVHPDVAVAIGAERQRASDTADEVLRRIQAMPLHDADGNRKQLFAYQAEGAAWISTRPRALLTDEPGLGKTPQIACAWRQGAPVLVIGPKVAMGTWADHASWRGDFDPAYMAGLRGFVWPQPGCVRIGNYEILPPFELLAAKPEELEKFTPKQREALAWVRHLAETCPDGLILVYDEAHKLKNPDAKRTIRAHVVRDLVLARGGWIWVVTGTPLYNHPPDLYAMIQLAKVEAETWPTHASFCASFGGAEGDTSWSKEGVHPDVPKILQRVMLRREKADVLSDLPEKQWQHITVPIPDDARQIADEAVAMLEAVGVQIKDGDEHGRSCTCLVCRVEVAQATKLGAIPFDLISRARASLATAKVEFLREYVENLEEQQAIVMNEADEPVVADPFLVWSCHRTPIDALGKRDGWASLTGEVNDPEKRRQLERDFQAGKYRAMGLTVQAGGVAITLTRASLSIHVDLPWTPADQQQAEDRCILAGQIVQTRNGPTPIEAVKAGDEVLSHTGEWRRVTATKRREHRGLVTSISYARYGFPLETTHDHKVLVARSATENPAWVKAHEVLPGDFLVMPRPVGQSEELREMVIAEADRPRNSQRSPHGGRFYKNGRRKPMPKTVIVDDELLFVFGFYLAEGFSAVAPGKGRFVSISGHAKERPILERCGGVFSRWGVSWSIYRSSVSVNAIEMRAYSADLARWFRRLFGHGAKNKSIPDVLLNLPARQAKFLLDGYIEGDGYERNAQREWSSASPALAHQMALLALRCGYAPTLRIRKSDGAWVGCFTVNGKSSSVKLRTWTDRHVFQPVHSVTTAYAERKTIVHDLTVADDHSFVIGQAVVHNCHRIGQKNAVRYVYLVADHRLDRWLVALLGHKAGIEAASVRAAATTVAQSRVSVGPPAVPDTAPVVKAPGAKRPPRSDEQDVLDWIVNSTHSFARAMNRARKRDGGVLSDAQWAAATTQARK